MRTAIWGGGGLSVNREEGREEGERIYLAGDHGVAHVGWVLIALVDCGDKVYICRYDDGRACLSFLLGLP